MTTPTKDPRRRFCPVCEQMDDHPRHQIVGTVNKIAPHMDCCASVGCPDGSCDIVIRDKGRKTGSSFQTLVADQIDETNKLLAQRPAEVAHFTLDDVDQNVHGGLAAGGAPTEMGLTER